MESFCHRATLSHLPPASAPSCSVTPSRCGHRTLTFWGAEPHFAENRVRVDASCNLNNPTMSGNALNGSESWNPIKMAALVLGRRRITTLARLEQSRPGRRARVAGVLLAIGDVKILFFDGYSHDSRKRTVSFCSSNAQRDSRSPSKNISTVPSQDLLRAVVADKPECVNPARHRPISLRRTHRPVFPRVLNSLYSRTGPGLPSFSSRRW